MRSSRKPRYNLIGAGEEDLLGSAGQAASSGMSTARTVFIAVAIIASALALGVAVPGLVYTIKAWRSQDSQSLRADQLEATQVSVQQSLASTSSLIDARVTVLNSSLTALNQTVLSELMILNEFLNVTSSGNGTFSEILELVINNVVGGDISMLMTQVNDRIRSINGVPGDATMHNVNLVADTGITVAPGPGAHQVTIGNAGVTSIMASGPGVGVSSATGDVVVSSSGVATINGVPAGSMMAGELSLSVTAMLALLNDVNASQITIDATALVNSITNLQNEDATLASNIMNLQTADTNLQMQITALESVGTMLTDMGMDVNMTVMELLAKTMMNEERVEQLETQLANLTSVSLPTGAMIPWAGADTMIPDGYLLCDGTIYNDGDYQSLSSAIGQVYCDPPLAPGSMQFCVPDMRGRVPVGRATAGSTFDMGELGGAPGMKIGLDRVTLSAMEMAPHTHDGTTNADGAHNHVFSLEHYASGTTDGPSIIATGQCSDFALTPTVNAIGSDVRCHLAPPFSPTSERRFTNLDTGSSIQHSHAFTTNANTGGAAHQNLQPSLIMHYIIKT